MAESLFKELMRLRENYKCQHIPRHLCSDSKFEDSLESNNLNVNMNFICATVQGIVFLYCIFIVISYLHYCVSLPVFTLNEKISLKLMTKDTLLLF